MNRFESEPFESQIPRTGIELGYSRAATPRPPTLLNGGDGGILNQPLDSESDGRPQHEIYAEMMEHYRSAMDTVASGIADPGYFHEFRSALAHGDRPPAIIQLEDKLTGDFFDPQTPNGSWLEEHLDETLASRRTDPELRSTVEQLGPEEFEQIRNRAFLHYIVERDLVGPGVVAFAKTVRNLQDQGVIKGKLIGMLRDFQPFLTALTDIGVEVHPMYLRRAFFGMDDPFTPGDESQITTPFSARLGKWFYQAGIFTEPDITLLDSGCWGTVVYEVALIRSLLSHAATNGHLSQIIDAQTPQERAAIFFRNIPPDLWEALNTAITDKEKNTRFQLLTIALGKTKTLQQIPATGLRTTAFDFYSHQWNDPRYHNPREVPSWVDIKGAGLVPASAGEVIGDTIEELRASKYFRGPTDLELNGDGSVGPKLEVNKDFGIEMVARAARKGIRDAVKIDLAREKEGITHDPRATLKRILELFYASQQDQVYRGTLFSNTPTWEHGEWFLGEMFPMITGPNSTLYTIPAEAIARA